MCKMNSQIKVMYTHTHTHIHMNIHIHIHTMVVIWASITFWNPLGSPSNTYTQCNAIYTNETTYESLDTTDSIGAQFTSLPPYSLKSRLDLETDDPKLSLDEITCCLACSSGERP